MTLAFNAFKDSCPSLTEKQALAFNAHKVLTMIEQRDRLLKLQGRAWQIRELIRRKHASGSRTTRASRPVRMASTSWLSTVTIASLELRCCVEGI